MFPQAHKKGMGPNFEGLYVKNYWRYFVIWWPITLEWSTQAFVNSGSRAPPFGEIRYKTFLGLNLTYMCLLETKILFFRLLCGFFKKLLKIGPPTVWLDSFGSQVNIIWPIFNNCLYLLDLDHQIQWYQLVSTILHGFPKTQCKREGVVVVNFAMLQLLNKATQPHYI